MHFMRDCVCGCTCVNAGVHRGQNSLRYPRARMTGSCELPKVGAGN